MVDWIQMHNQRFDQIINCFHHIIIVAAIVQTISGTCTRTSTAIIGTGPLLLLPWNKNKYLIPHDDGPHMSHIDNDTIFSCQKRRTGMCTTTGVGELVNDPQIT